MTPMVSEVTAVGARWAWRPTPVEEDAESQASRRRWVIGAGAVGALIAALWLFEVLAPFKLFGNAAVILSTPTSVAQIALERAGEDASISLVLQDAAGRDAPLAGDLEIELQEPNGAVWRVSRAVAPTDFSSLPSGVLAGRLGYRVVVPARDWVRPPRRGGLASVTVVATPRGGTSFTGSTSTAFP